MRNHGAVPLVAGIGLSICALGSARPAFGLQVTLRGTVADSTGAPITQVDVGVVSLHRLTRTDDEGRFAFNRLTGDSVELSFRRLGYRPRTLKLALASPSDSLRVVLAEQAEILDPTEVSAHVRRLRVGVEEFYRRRTLGMGTYFTREEIQARHAHATSDVLRNTPGIRFVRTSSGLGVRFNNTSIVRRDCMPMIWIDGQKAPAMEVDDIPVNDIEGIELYNGASTTPLQFSQQMRNSTCGTIAVWSRVPGS